MRLLVCGGRKYGVPNRYTSQEEYDRKIEEAFFLYEWLDEHEANHGPYECIIHGGATGADELAGKWATDLGILVKIFPADWDFHGKRAGYLRNKQMLDEGQPNLVVAFPGGKGTANMVKLAREAGVEVIIAS